MKIIKNDSLKPCPFCGEYPIIRKLGYDEEWVIECTNPKCAIRPETLSSFDEPEKAIAAWNERA